MRAPWTIITTVRSLSLLAGLVVSLAAAPSVAQQAFVNVTGGAGIAGQDGLGHAVAWGDLDGDGDQDLAFSNQDGSGFWLYRNEGDGTFTDVTAAAGLGSAGAGKILWTELTGDTHADLLLSFGGCRLYRNAGDGTFANVTGGSGLTGTPEGVADVDNDGLCDVITETNDQLVWHRALGDGVFDGARVIGPVGSTLTSVCFDMDLDGDVDVCIGTYGATPNQLFRNEGDGTFSEVAAAAGVDFPHASHGLTVGDFDNDGWPDLYVGGYSAQRCRLFRNEGDGTFSDITAAAGVTGYPDTRTVSVTDFDNDGHLDIFASHHDFYTYSNVMWHNQGDGTFVDVAVDLGLSGEFVGDYFGVGWADFDGDADLDLFAAGHIDRYRLFRNDDAPGQALLVDLVGTRSNRGAIGAWATAHAADQARTRFVVAGSGQRDQSSLTLEFGLGAVTMVDSVVVHWPRGDVETFGPFAAGQRVTLVEAADVTGAGAPGSASLTLAAAPNPFNPRVRVTFALPRPGHAELIVRDLRGRRVRELFSGTATAGTHYRNWHGTDDRGLALPSGVYALQLTVDGATTVRHVTLVR